MTTCVCGAGGGDAWRCAKRLGLQSISCKCECHRYIQQQAAALRPVNQCGCGGTFVEKQAGCGVLTCDRCDHIYMLASSLPYPRVGPKLAIVWPDTPCAVCTVPRKAHDRAVKSHSYLAPP